MSTPFLFRFVPALNGVRAIAVMMVMFFHAGLPVYGGYIGVDLFFVLSGFLITALLVSEFDHTHSINLRNFYIRRMVRLLPALILCLVVFCFASFWLFDSTQATKNLVDALIALFYVANWTRALGFDRPDFLGHTWSLAVEEQFYLFWPLIFGWLMFRIRSRMAVVAIIIFLAGISFAWRLYAMEQGSPFYRLYNALDMRADSLMIGCAAGMAYASGMIRDWISSFVRLIAPWCGFIFLVIAFTIPPYSYPMCSFGYTLVAVLSIVIIVDVVTNPEGVLSKICSIRWLVWIGGISYGLYLWHYPVYRIMTALGYDDVLTFVFGSLLTFILATASYVLIETPFLKFKNRFVFSKPS